MPLDAKAHKILIGATTATITTILLKQGLRNVWMRGTLPLAPGQGRVAGPAFTLRFVPAREDLATLAAWSSPVSTRAAIEAMPEGCVVVADAMGVTDAGIVGDILCARMKVRGVAALVTDGVMRDAEGVQATGLAVFCRGAAAPPAVARMIFAGWQQPVGLRRGGGVSGRRGGGGQRRGGADPGRLSGPCAGRGAGAGARRGLDHGTGAPGGAVTGALSDEPGDQGALCGVDRIVGRREGLTTVAGGKIGGTGLGRIRSAGGKGRPARNDLAAPTMEPESALKYGWTVNRATP